MANSDDARFRTVCPHCKHRFVVRRSHLGKTAKCTHCEKTFLTREVRQDSELPPKIHDKLGRKSRKATSNFVKRTVDKYLESVGGAWSPGSPHLRRCVVDSHCQFSIHETCHICGGATVGINVGDVLNRTDRRTQQMLQIQIASRSSLGENEHLVCRSKRQSLLNEFVRAKVLGPHDRGFKPTTFKPLNDVHTVQADMIGLIEGS